MSTDPRSKNLALAYKCECYGSARLSPQRTVLRQRTLVTAAHCVTAAHACCRSVCMWHAWRMHVARLAYEYSLCGLCMQSLTRHFGYLKESCFQRSLTLA